MWQPDDLKVVGYNQRRSQLYYTQQYHYSTEAKNWWYASVCLRDRQSRRNTKTQPTDRLSVAEDTGSFCTSVGEFL